MNEVQEKTLTGSYQWAFYEEMRTCWPLYEVQYKARGHFVDFSVIEHDPTQEGTEEKLSLMVKWDGCSHLQAGYQHLCGPRCYNEFAALLRALYRKAFELMAAHPEGRKEPYTPSIAPDKLEGGDFGFEPAWPPAEFHLQPDAQA